MTALEIITAARNRYNAVSDSFFSDAEMYEYLTAACNDAAVKTLIIEGLDSSTSTVAGTQSYAFPTDFIAIKRITYDGIRLDPIAMIEDDAITGLSQSTTDQGTPGNYWTWNDTIYLRPLPAEAKVLKIWGPKKQAAISAAATVPSIPVALHHHLTNYVLQEMCAKDSNWPSHDRYASKWMESLADMKAWVRKRKRTDGFAVVQSEEINTRGI